MSVIPVNPEVELHSTCPIRKNDADNVVRPKIVGHLVGVNKLNCMFYKLRQEKKILNEILEIVNSIKINTNSSNLGSNTPQQSSNTAPIDPNACSNLQTCGTISLNCVTKVVDVASTAVNSLKINTNSTHLGSNISNQSPIEPNACSNRGTISLNCETKVVDAASTASQTAVNSLKININSRILDSNTSHQSSNSSNNACSDLLTCGTISLNCESKMVDVASAESSMEQFADKSSCNSNSNVAKHKFKRKKRSDHHWNGKIGFNESPWLVDPITHLSEDQSNLKTVTSVGSPSDRQSDSWEDSFSQNSGSIEFNSDQPMDSRNKYITYVGGLPHFWDVGKVRGLFKRYGNIQKIDLKVMDCTIGNIAFIHFSTENSMERSIKALDKIITYGKRHLTVRKYYKSN